MQTNPGSPNANLHWQSLNSLDKRNTGALAKARALLKGFGLGIDALVGAAIIRGSAIDQAPARVPHLTAVELGSNDDVFRSARLTQEI